MKLSVSQTIYQGWPQQFSLNLHVRIEQVSCQKLYSNNLHVNKAELEHILKDFLKK
jgi:hypothetical protein